MAQAGRPATAREVVALIKGATSGELDELALRYGQDPRQQVRKALAAALRRVQREQAEHDRVRQMYELQQQLAEGGLALGVDEVGRGAVAGPLTVCAVALPREPMILGLNDSKQLTPARREALAAQVRKRALAVGIAHIEPAAIDAVGMAVALRMGMSQAIDDAKLDADWVLIDGNPVHVHPRERTLVKGDARVACIAAASIVAKVTRDAHMAELAHEYPAYHWDACKGYASAEHIEAIRAHGLTPYHRASFCVNFMEAPRLF